MITACWSLKGGVGTTVVAAGLALVQQRRFGEPTLLVDLAGDQAVLLGLPEPAGPGVAEWLAAGSSAPPDALARLETPVAPGLTFLHRGRADLNGVRAALLVQMLSLAGRTVVIDCGTLRGDRADGVAAQVAGAASRSLLVTRPCYLALRRAASSPCTPSGVVVVRDQGRSLSDREVGTHLRAPVVASVALDPAVARAADAGLLVSRLPRSFTDVMRALA